MICLKILHRRVTIGTESICIKKGSSSQKKQATWDLGSDERVVVNFDETSQLIGDEAKDFTRFLGTLVKMPQHVAIDVDDWRKIPVDKKEDLWNIMKGKFYFAPAETEEIKNWVMYDMGVKWRSWKYDLKRISYDPNLYVTGQEEGEKNKVIRSKSKEPHITGTKSFARIIHEEGIIDWTTDDLAQVKGRERGGRIRCMGKVVMPKGKGSCSSQDPQVPVLKTRIHELEEEVKVLTEKQVAMDQFMSTVKQHMPNINFSIFNDSNKQVPNDSCSAYVKPKSSRTSQNHCSGSRSRGKR